jgi:hypothetical protein
MIDHSSPPRPVFSENTELPSKIRRLAAIESASRFTNLIRALDNFHLPGQFSGRIFHSRRLRFIGYCVATS